MAVNPGNIAYGMPPAEDDQVRKARDTQRAQQENAAARTLAASQIGNGGVLQVDGSLNVTGAAAVSGSLTVSGTLSVPAGSLNTAGNITAGGSLNGASVAATGALTGASVAVTGAATAATVTATGQVHGDTAVFPTGVNSVGVYNTLLTYGGGYKTQYVHADGTMGYVPSSREFKQDIASATINPALLTALRLVTFRYINAVENLGDKAETEIGVIAQEVEALGLHWLVDYGSDGKPIGVKYERLALLVIPWAQSIEARLAALEG